MTKRWIAYPLAWLVAMLVPTLVLTWESSSGANDPVNQFRIDSFDARYTAIPAGDRLSLQVTERITVSFHNPRTHHGIERRLDASYGDTSIELDDIEVTDPSGRPLSFTTREAGDDVVLRIGDRFEYVTGTKTYVIDYTIGNAMVEADDRQELYLDVNGTGWLQPFTRITATLDASRVAPGLLGEQACYRGPAGASTPCVIIRDGDTFRAEATELRPGETMTIAVGFQPGTVAATVPLPALRPPGPVGILAMPAGATLVLGLALLVRARRRHLPGSAADPRFSPPEGIPPIAAADFLGRPEAGAAAQLTDLVLTGAVTITAEGEPVATAAQHRGRLPGRQVDELRSGLVVTLHDPDRIEDPTLRSICTALFGRGRPVRLDGTTNTAIASATAGRDTLLDSLDLRKAAVGPRVLLVAGMAALLVWGWVLVAFGSADWMFLTSGVLAVLLLVVAVHFYPAVGGLTDRGRTVRDQLAGLHRFVTMAEADRISWLQNAVDAPRVTGPDAATSLVKLYEPLLPWAIVFGVERTWRDLLGPLTAEPAATAAPVPVAEALAVADVADRPALRLHDRRRTRSSWWQTRPAWGEGWVARSADAFGRWRDERRSARDDDGTGGSWRSSGSRRSSGGSSGRVSAGGGMGGGGGGGW